MHANFIYFIQLKAEHLCTVPNSVSSFHRLETLWPVPATNSISFNANEFVLGASGAHRGSSQPLLQPSTLPHALKCFCQGKCWRGKPQLMSFISPLWQSSALSFSLFLPHSVHWSLPMFTALLFQVLLSTMQTQWEKIGKQPGSGCISTSHCLGKTNKQTNKFTFS